MQTHTGRWGGRCVQSLSQCQKEGTLGNKPWWGMEQVSKEPAHPGLAGPGKECGQSLTDLAHLSRQGRAP